MTHLDVDSRGWVTPVCFADHPQLWRLYYFVFNTAVSDYISHYNAASTNHISRARMEKFAKAVALARLKGTL